MPAQSTKKPKDYSGSNVRELRKLGGYSRNEITKRLEEFDVHMHQTSLRRIEEGQQPLKIVEALAFCEIFKVTLKELITRPVDPTSAMVEGQLRKAKSALGTIFNAHSYLTFAVHELNKMLKDDNLPPAEQSQSVREAKAWLEELLDSEYWFRRELAQSFLIESGMLSDPDTGANFVKSRWFTVRPVEDLESFQNDDEG